MKGKRCLLLMMVFAVFLSSFNFSCIAASALTLPTYFTDINEEIGIMMPFKPPHNYKSMQNPPDFTWPPVNGAIYYGLQITDESGEVKYSAKSIEQSYYNFSHTFEPGTYYWQVRCWDGTNTSNWSAKRKFIIDPDAWEFTVPPIAEIVNKVPESHPRIYMTKDTVEKFKKYAETSSGAAVLSRMISVSDNYINELENTENKSFSDMEKYEDPEISEATSVASSLTARARIPALVYILTNKEEYKDYAIKALLHMCTWDYTDDTKGTSFKGQDQGFFEVLIGASMAYDWLYNYMTDEQIDTVKTMLSGRFDVVKEKSLTTLRKNPYDSHIWSYFGYYGTACIALMHDVENVDYYFGQMLSLFLANVPPMSTEDGGWSKGTAYWTYAFSRDKWFMDILALGGYINTYSKAWTNNEYLWQMYMYPFNSYGSFGDESNFSKPGTSHIMGLSKLALLTGNPVAAWSKNKIGTVSGTAGLQFDSLMFAGADEMEERAPFDYPKSHTFIDQGMTAMHSSILSDDRISLYFRSGRYGSYNHMHADQNSFFVEAFGERLAIKSGFYDSYHSVHDSGFTRKTFAHNSVTFDNGIGQKDDSMNANGNTEMFVTTNYFDAVVGNATRAYNGGLGKFIRSIVYIRPDVYVVIDDLEAASGNSSVFEWALNAPSDTLNVKNNSEATIKNNKAVLDAKIHYPDSITNTGLIQNYEDLNGNDIPPNERYSSRSPQDRVYFKTDKVTSAKIIATMNVHKEGEPAENIAKEETSGYVVLSFDNGTKVIINKGSETSEVSYKNVKFKGRAAVFNGEAIMLVSGTSLYYENSKVFTSDRAVTLVLGGGELSVSSDDDYNIYLGTGNRYIPDDLSLFKIRELNISKMKKRELSPSIGISAVYSDNDIKFTAIKGHYKLLLNDMTIISSDELIPQNVSVIKTSDGKIKINWDAAKKSTSVDVLVNGTLYENVEAPFYPECTDNVIFVSARGKSGSLVSEWSQKARLNTEAKESVSHTEFIITDKNGNRVLKPVKDGKVSFNLSLRNYSGVNKKIVFAQYDNNGKILDISMDDIPLNNEIEKDYVSPQISILQDGAKIKSFIFDFEKFKPLSNKSSTDVVSATLNAITLDGKPLDGFQRSKFEYDVILGEDGLVPVVKGIVDNSVYTSVSYENDDVGGAIAKIYTEARGGEKAIYIINFVKSNNNAILPVSDLKLLQKGKTFQQYCMAIGFEHDLSEISTKKIPGAYNLMNFTLAGDLCGANDQRKITEISKKLGIENTLFIGTDASLSQTSSSADWIVAAYYGKSYTITDETSPDFGKTVDFSKFNIPWFSVKINKPCEAIVLSYSRIEEYENDPEWGYIKLKDEPYHAIRYYDTTKYPPEKYTQSDVSGYYNMYVKSCKEGEELMLYNENSGVVSPIPYFTFFRF